MISSFRRYLETWYVRAFFFLMVASFVLWGVGDMLRVIGTTTWTAKVAGSTIETTAFEEEYHRALSTATRDLPNGQEPSAALRREVGEQTLKGMIGLLALKKELADMRIVVPDAVLAESVRKMPAFRGADGNFDRLRFEALLRSNSMTEAGFLALMRADIARKQLLEAVAAASRVPDVAAQPIYAGQFEKRSADLAEFPFAAVPEPAVPDEAAAHRWYDNHPELYATPERRRIKAIVLSTRVLSPEISVSDQEVKTSYDANQGDYTTIAKRSARVISAQDEATALALAEKWRAESDWATMEAAASAAGASAISQDDATEKQFPDPDLAKAVFAAPVDTVPPPVKGRLGWFVIKVTRATEGGTTPFDQVKALIRDRLATEKALELVYDRANKIDGALGNGGTLDALPPGLGVTPFTVTVDKRGYTPEETAAEIPGEDEVRTALVAAAFDSPKNEPPRLVEVQTPSSGGSGYFALVVEDVTPSGMKPFEAVAAAVSDDWRKDQRRRGAEQAASAMMKAVKDGKAFSDAATEAGVIPRLSPQVTRTVPDAGLPLEAHRVLFSLKKGEPTMVETPVGFLVAMVVEVISPDPKADPAGYEQLRAAVTRSVGTDIATVFSEALRLRANPRINQTSFDQIVQP